MTRNNHIILALSLAPPGAGRADPPEDIRPPYPWATTKRAITHSIQYLVSHGINIITGRVQCKRCERQFEIQYDLLTKFREVGLFIFSNRVEMKDRAPKKWMNPALPDCEFCHQGSCVKPVSVPGKENINWLWLFLGEMVGCCKLEELKYFCEHTGQHRTGAKDRVLYQTYLEILKQLDPEENFLT